MCFEKGYGMHLFLSDTMMLNNSSLVQFAKRIVVQNYIQIYPFAFINLLNFFHIFVKRKWTWK